MVVLKVNILIHIKLIQNFYLLLVQIEDFHKEITISNTEDQLMLDEQQGSVNFTTDSVGDKLSKCVVYKSLIPLKSI